MYETKPAAPLTPATADGQLFAATEGGLRHYQGLDYATSTLALPGNIHKAQVAAAAGVPRRSSAPPDRLGRVFLWSLPGLVVRELLAQERRAFSALAWSPDGALLAAGASNGTVALCDAWSGEMVAEVIAHGDEVTALRFGAAGKLLSASTDGSIAVIAWRI